MVCLLATVAIVFRRMLISEVATDYAEFSGHVYEKACNCWLSHTLCAI